VARPRIVLRGGLVAAVAATLLALWPAPAAADLSDPPGACVVTSSWGDSGVTVNSASVNPSDVIDVPKTNEVTWSAGVNGPAEGTVRPVAGSVYLALPAPLGKVTIGHWAASTGKVETSGIANLPDLLPAGVGFQIRMEHYEKGSLFCTASVRLRTTGGPSPLAWGSLAATLLVGALLTLIGFKGHCSFLMRLLSGGLGLLGGALAGSDLVLFGVLPLDSIATVLLAAAGLITGSFLCKFRRERLRRKKKKEDKKDEQARQPVGGTA